MIRLVASFVALGLVLAGAPAPAQDKAASRRIETWGTAQQLNPVAPRRAPANNAQPTAPRPPQTPSPMVPYPATLSDQTIRMIVRTSAGGTQLQLEFGNAVGESTVRFGEVRVALAGQESEITTRSDRSVTFGGQPGLTLFPGAKAISDPINLKVPPLTELAVSVYLPDPTPTNTVHALGLNPAFIATGNVVSAQRLDQAFVTRSYFWLTGLSLVPDVPKGGTIVAFGDSITDGYATTPRAHRAWPNLLAERLQANPAKRGWGVVNAGISGNRVLRTGAGDSALARFDEDVLSRPGVKWVLLLEGINDINMTIMPVVPDTEDVTAEQIIQGYAQLISRAHMHGIKVAGGTILPTKGFPFYSEQGEALRRQINAWIRSSGRFDAVIDFDAATRDPVDPLRLRPDYNPGDHVHPNDAGNRAMADRIDLSIFR